MIVVTGANGTLGRAVMARLRGQGIPAKAISRDIIDLASDKTLVSVVSGKPSGIIHLAAVVPGTPSSADTEEAAAITRRIDRTVYGAAAQWHCPVIYSSTCSLYDRQDSDWWSEDRPLPIELPTPYLRAKADGEKLFLSLESGVVLRISALIGKGLPGHIVASRFVTSAAAGGEIELWGSGSREQDFVDIQDYAAALIAAVEKAPGRSIINVARGEPITMLELARLVINTLGSGSYYFGGMPDPRDCERARFANRRARELLGWSPATSLADSIRSMATEIQIH